MVDPDRVRERLGRLEPLLALLDEVRASGEQAYFSEVWEALADLDDLRDYAAAVNRAISG